MDPRGGVAEPVKQIRHALELPPRILPLQLGLFHVAPAMPGEHEARIIGEGEVEGQTHTLLGDGVADDVRGGAVGHGAVFEYRVGVRDARREGSARIYTRFGSDPGKQFPI